MFDGVGKGKYTIGLEQDTMAFVNDREDIYSMSLTAVQSILEKYKIPHSSIGRLEVGTETIIDKSKSIKSVLMTLFEKSGCTDIEGIDTINACYGGTQALFNAANWIESSSWDGRDALVVCGDIAVYSPGPARPTGGAGVVTMLIGKDAPITLERVVRGSFFQHAYDFYKPNLESEYPIVDGHHSINCYFRALDNCYSIYADRYKKLYGKDFSADSFDFTIFHSPFMKQVRKSFARLYYLDYLRNHNSGKFLNVNPKLRTLSVEDSYGDKELQNTFGELSKSDFEKKVEPSSLLPKNLGNSYTASMYTGLLSLLSQKNDRDLIGKRIGMFSYGSGLAATLFSLQIKSSTANISKISDIHHRLEQRSSIAPEEYSRIMKQRETIHGAGDYIPSGKVNELFPGTYYLTNIDKEKRRYYERT